MGDIGRYVPPKNFSRPNATSKGSTGKEGKPAENNHLSSSFPSKRIHRVVDTQSEFEGIFLVGFTEEEKKKEEERKIFGRWFYVPGRWWSGWVASEKRGCGSRASTHIIFFLSRFAKSQPCVTHQLQSSNYELQGFASW
ncbi:hypothetical protein M441DRAFT_354164 [Trichoderma asperellum CBS 433.97]|uniref:Uncharacterized protein n=1 Tax=Trichoderma asperellum (strain ATCC 204424 / CBS 433.97 / NBRC 101777) TaxID=1042311 RepID=A0A2T3ZIS4_TRIA4|nr:hypothetical protein M441DRAFT_354164 [Trichoderma asperellum CBS 433.97]PTB44700.1 hypothetical protein M441DRAFT_354164 [Trichoderma asperellum CBS 433.97]